MLSLARLIFLSSLLALVIAGLGSVGVSADPAPLPAGPPAEPGDSNTAGREANAYYQDCLARRDNGDMKCGESCFWRECITCVNVCTLNCVESYDCGCRSIPCCPDP